MIKWTATKEEMLAISLIADRADHLIIGGLKDRLSLLMDIESCHCNGCPLDLGRLLDASNADFIHDVSGIQAKIDRDTGELTDCFLPRHALKG